MRTNFIEAHCRSPFSAEFFYFDVPDYKADDIFLEKGLYPRFFEEMSKDDSEYVLIRCRVKRRDRHKFVEAMNELARKMLLTGYPDYLDHAKEIWEQLDEAIQNEEGSSNGKT